MKNNRSHILLLLLAAFFWGTTFVAQSIGADYVGAFTYLAGRSWIAVVFLTPIIRVMDKFADKRGIDNRRPKNAADRKQLAIAGILCGASLCVASAAQQTGMAYTTASKAGFITALYVILVPIVSIFFKKKPSAHIWICVAASLVGMYLLCMTTDSFSLSKGDAFVLASACLFTINIMVIDHFSPLVDGVRLSRIQFLTVAVLSTIIMLIAEHPTADAVVKAFFAILYAGIFSSGIAYTCQILGQRDVDPTVASLVMSLESVFSALSGWLVLGERLTGRELAGCVLMFAAIIFSQIEFKGKKA